MVCHSCCVLTVGVRAHAGHRIYYGPASKAMSFAANLGYVPAFAVNPADFLLDLASDETTIACMKEASRKRIDDDDDDDDDDDGGGGGGGDQHHDNRGGKMVSTQPVLSHKEVVAITMPAKAMQTGNGASCGRGRLRISYVLVS